MEEQISSKHADARKNDDARAALEEEKSKLTERRKGLWRQQEKDER